MRQKTGLWAVLALFSLFLVCLPGIAHAQDTSGCQPGQPKANLDAQVAQNTQAYENELFTRSQNIANQFPVVQAVDACIQQMTDLIAKLPSLGNPFSLGQILINQLLMSVISQTCSAVSGVISSAQNLVTSFAHICIPLSPFNLGLNLGQLKPAAGCSSGTQINLLTSFGSSSPRPVYNYQQYMSGSQ